MSPLPSLFSYGQAEKYAKAVLEMCRCKLNAFPQIARECRSSMAPTRRGRHQPSPLVSPPAFEDKGKRAKDFKNFEFQVRVGGRESPLAFQASPAGISCSRLNCSSARPYHNTQHAHLAPPRLKMYNAKGKVEEVLKYATLWSLAAGFGPSPLALVPRRWLWSGFLRFVPFS